MSDLLNDLARARVDPAFFSHRFCRRKLHDGQAEWIASAEARVNVLATGNRYGKTSIVTVGHFWHNIFKIGGEPRYTNEDGSHDLERMVGLAYETAHAAPTAELSKIVWADARRLVRGSKDLAAWVAKMPRSEPPNIEFIHGARWRIRTVGDDASGLDGASFYLVTVDEAGWLTKLEEMMDNVIFIRIADVRGKIWLVGTMKPGETSAGFHKYALRAAAYSGAKSTVEHRAAPARRTKHPVDPSIYRYAEEEGLDLDELLDVVTGQAA